ncbi:MAG: hypothetical protein LBR76_01510 [Oscillospiraceae bacterium]|jgi:hypothetical protein|nr:hypothetical protein [Oscillospiraceae bacterium]
MLILAIFTGVASLFNYFWWANYMPSPALQYVSLAAQVLLTAVTAAAAIGFRGRRTRKNYDGARFKVFTLSYALVFFSLLGNLAVLTVLVLFKLGVLKAL